ncbi:MAG: ABC transporter ATP-binding protein, partial [Planctomycetota bacterium]
PHELSGGERQRVALARALVGEPKILLLDEPMANLDQGLKRDLLDAVRKIQEEVGVTMIYVTHDQREALSIGQTLAVMEEGRLLQTGPSLDLYYKPSSTFVARFLGRNNVLSGTAEGGTFRCSAGDFPLEGDAPDGEATVAIRAEDISLCPDPEGPLTAKTCVFQGARHVVVCSAGELEVTAESLEAIAPGTRLSAEARRPAFVFPA